MQEGIPLYTTVPRSDRDSILKMAKGVLIVRQGHAILERPTYTQVQGLSIDSFSVKSISKAQFVVSFEILFLMMICMILMHLGHFLAK